MPRFIVFSEPRTGSTYLRQLLNIHFHVKCTGELLGNQYGPKDDPIGDVDRKLSALCQPVVGFKTFPEHLIYHKLSVVELVRRLDVKWVIVLWRERCLDMYVSLQIAQRTNVWFCTEPNSQVETVKVDGTGFLQHLANMERQWKDVVRGWPPDVVPIFVKYEELAENCTLEMQRILRCMSVDPSEYELSLIHI